MKELSCLIIGEGTLVIKCSELLLNNNIRIVALVSRDYLVKKWALDRNLLYLNSINDILPIIKKDSIDLLFSIVNSWILDKEILSLPRMFAINYHDSLLPKYAGNNATFWAILNNEKMHGVTWHIMKEKVDSGPILRQSCFEVVEDETAVSLNAKCYEAAINSFKTLINDIRCNRVVQVDKNNLERTFYSNYKRPSSACILSFNNTVKQIETLYRALDYGAFNNPIGKLKVFIKGEFYIINSMMFSRNKKSAVPGTITYMDDHKLEIATIDGKIEINELATADSSFISIKDLVTNLNLTVGTHLPEMRPTYRENIANRINVLASFEKFWVDRIINFQPLVLPLKNERLAATHQFPLTRDSFNFLKYFDSLKNKYDGVEGIKLATTLLLIYLGRICEILTFDIKFSYDGILEGGERNNLFADAIPLRISFEASWDLITAYNHVSHQINIALENKTYIKDIFLRYKDIKCNSKEIAENRNNILIKISKTTPTKVYNQEADIEINIVEDELNIIWVYKEGMWEDKTIQIYRQGFKSFLNNLITNPDKRIANLSLISLEERAKIFNEFNNTSCCYPTNLIHKAFEKHAVNEPSLPALIQSGRSISYYDLNNLSNYIAHNLLRISVKEGDFIPILMQAGIEYVAAILAVMKVGSTFVPLDSFWPKERIKDALVTLGSRVVLTQECYQDWDIDCYQMVINSADCKTIYDNPIAHIELSSPIYGSYTSGTTGKPKLAIVSHDGLINRFMWMNRYFGIEAAAATLQTTHHSFDSSVWQLLWPLTNKGKAIIPEHNMKLDINYLTTLIFKHKVSIVDFVPSVFNMLVPLITQETTYKERLSSIKHIILGGEEINQKSVEEFLSHISHIPLTNLYGPTETTIGCVSFTLTEKLKHRIPIGKPISNSYILILDTFNNLVPVGMRGEIHIAGKCVGLGYYKNDAETNKKFIKNSFMEIQSEKLYKTGDYGRYLPDGNIEFLGRIDTEIKLHGYRIDLQDIEAVLLNFPEVKEAVVLCHADSSKVKKLLAYVVPSTKKFFTNRLSDYVKGVLPSYMCPYEYYLIDEIPLSVSGKIDKTKLISLPKSCMITKTNLSSPKTALQEDIIKIWEAVLNVKILNTDVNFFDLGGNSLLLTIVHLELQKIIRAYFPLAELFRHTSIKNLANYLSTLKAKVGTREL